MDLGLRQLIVASCFVRKQSRRTCSSSQKPSTITVSSEIAPAVALTRNIADPNLNTINHLLQRHRGDRSQSGFRFQEREGAIGIA
jgi:hypothetical protein